MAGAGLATGGTELLHQFSRCLSDNGIESYMIYPDADSIKCPTPETFLKYGVKYVNRYVDDYDAVLVLAETQVHLARECVKGTVMLWWLSVDNYLLSYREQFKRESFDLFDLKSRKNILHFVQSQYAKEFLEKYMGIANSHFLMDYINDDIMEAAALCQNAYDRKNICLYNPKKGYETLKPIMDSCREDIKWMPLTGYTPAEMAELMCQAKLYVDFGHHPGKDRIPREAAICGCCILTNRMGSAAYQEDVGIPECYKIEDTGNISLVLDKIYDLVDYYEERKEEYSGYRAIVAGEKAGFMKDLKNAIDILKDCVGARSRNICFDGVKYEKMIGSIGNAAEQLGGLMAAARMDCLHENRSQMANKLLTADYVIQVIRETIYAQLIDLAEENNPEE